ncbi:MAG: response regulator transcription factor [Desulfobacterales bacterium]
MKRTRILLADDHKIVLEGLRSLLEPEFELVGTAEDGRTLLRLSEKLQPDVIVVDISMPLLNGIEAVRQIKEISPDISIVFLTMHPDVTYAARAFDVGASGYVLKHSAPSELVTAIHSAMKGQIYITPAIAGELIQSYKDVNHFQKETTAELTPRQREVLQLLAEGHSGKEIADILCISPRTVEYHKYRMMEELGIKTSSELVGYAIKHGIVTI